MKKSKEAPRELITVLGLCAVVIGVYLFIGFQKTGAISASPADSSLASSLKSLFIKKPTELSPFQFAPSGTKMPAPQKYKVMIPPRAITTKPSGTASSSKPARTYIYPTNMYSMITKGTNTYTYGFTCSGASKDGNYDKNGFCIYDPKLTGASDNTYSLVGVYNYDTVDLPGVGKGYTIDASDTRTYSSSYGGQNGTCTITYKYDPRKTKPLTTTTKGVISITNDESVITTADICKDGTTEGFGLPPTLNGTLSHTSTMVPNMAGSEVYLGSARVAYSHADNLRIVESENRDTTLTLFAEGGDSDIPFQVIASNKGWEYPRGGFGRPDATTKYLSCGNLSVANGTPVNSSDTTERGCKIIGTANGNGQTDVTVHSSERFNGFYNGFNVEFQLIGPRR